MVPAATKQINIDFDVSKAIETARNSFDEEPNTILRRLLGISSSAVQLVGPDQRAGWSYGGVFLPNGTDLVMTYNGFQYRATVQSGALWANGRAFKSLSGVADHLTGQSLNGWKYWCAWINGQWVLTDSLRKQYAAHGDSDD